MTFGQMDQMLGGIGMAITQKEADEVEEQFLTAFPFNGKSDPHLAKKAWDSLYALMIRENNFSDRLGVDSIDWQIGNWANDVTMELHNAGLSQECIEVDEQILRIDWEGNDNTFHENALRDIADEYGYSGNPDKCLSLYEEYLEKDPLWGWGWIGYYRQLERHNDERFEQVLDTLYERVKAGEDFRDKEDLYRELGDEYNTLEDTERAEYFYGLEDTEKKRYKTRFAGNLSSLFGSQPVVKSKKIYPNDPCPCGSGKKYKKCCGKK